MTIAEAITFLKDMRAYQSSVAAKNAHIPGRAAGATDRAEKLGQVIDLLEPSSIVKQPSLTLLPSDLKDLPEELLRELSVTSSDFLDFEIVEIIDAAGGVMTLDHLIIALYRNKGEIHERSKLNSRLYRMTKKGMVKSLAGKKGVYATKDIVIDDLFDDEQGEEPSP